MCCTIIIDDNLPDPIPGFYALCQESGFAQRVLRRIGERPVRCFFHQEGRQGSQSSASSIKRQESRSQRILLACHCTKNCTILVAKKNKKFAAILLKADNKSVTIIAQGRENDLCFYKYYVYNIINTA